MQGRTMKSQQGFTVTDLLIIVTALALMAAIAVPRHTAINSETRARAVRSLAANVESSANLMHRVWRSGGYTDFLNIDGEFIEMHNGYPTDNSIALVVIERNEFQFAKGQWAHRDKPAQRGCSVQYIPPADPFSDARVLTYTDGC
jgi:Tfp pilus assembly protein PilE